jgi:uncharacterized protein YndB with AHSA1/START domain
MNEDLSRIERSIFIRAPRARVWRAIADVGEFAAWFQVKAEGTLTPGERVRMTTTHPDYAGITFFVNVQEIEPERRLSWRWQPGSEQVPEDDPTTLVEFTLAEEEGGTRVTVVESGFDQLALARRAKAYEENSTGWEYQMGALQRYAEA